MEQHWFHFLNLFNIMLFSTLGWSTHERLTNLSKQNSKAAHCQFQGSYYFAEFIFPDFCRQNEQFSLTNFFIRDTSKTKLSTQM